MPEHQYGPGDLVTIPEAAERLGVTPHTVNAYIRDGKLPVLELSRRVRFVIWPALSAEMRAIADQHAARQAKDRRRAGSKGSRMRRSRPDDPSGP